MTLASGARLGPYEILEPLGAGGMGEVWKARDTRLQRTVAIKVLARDLSSSAEIRQRFEREARTISQLSHAHICALYDVGREGDTEYLVMEYLEGETLSARLARGALPLEQTLRFGIEIADALNAAHRQGIVHRDLKPGNVMLTKAGSKLLDFGLAKAAAVAAPAGLSALPTAEHSLTAVGGVVGTVQYMAPEQLAGRDSDARSDIFALGAVLYEMSTGRRAFSGENQASVITAILRDEPQSIAALAPRTPPGLDRLVRTCLAKEADDRWQSAGDIAREMKWIAETAAGSALAPRDARRSRGRERLAWGVAAAALLLGAVAALLSRRPQAHEELMRFKIAPPSGQIFFGEVALSPDARRIVFLLQDEAGKNSIAVRPVDGLEIRRLPGTEEARGMFWSPDGREIAFFSEGRLKRTAAEGGPVQTICESGAAFSGAWGREGTILFTKDFTGPMVAVPASGGTPRPATSVDKTRGEVGHFHPAFLPDGRHFLFAASNVDPEKTWIRLGSLDSKDSRRLFPADSSAIFAEPGYLLFGRNGSLFAWRFDPEGVKLIGEPAPAFENVRALREDGFTSASAAGNRVVFVTWYGRRRLAWVDRKGHELGTLGEVGGYSDVRISPDGRRAAVARRDPSHGHNEDVWVLDVSRGTSSRITSEPGEEFNPAWFPDGERLVYVSAHGDGAYDLYERPASGGTEKTLAHSDRDKIMPTVSPDGRHLLAAISEMGNFSRSLLPLSGSGNPVPLSGDSRSSEQHPAFSPDGRWSAFDSNESGQREVYVQPIPAGPKRQVSIGGGQMPVWNRNGAELFYAARDGMLMSVALHFSGGRVESLEPQVLFLLRLGTSGELPWHRHPYDVSPDGQRFLVIRSAADAEPDGAVVVINWSAVLGKK